MLFEPIPAVKAFQGRRTQSGIFVLGRAGHWPSRRALTRGWGLRHDKCDARVPFKPDGLTAATMALSPVAGPLSGRTA